MSIGSRLSRMFRAWRFRGNDLENLKDKLDETYRTQATLLQQVRRAVADVATSRKRVELQLAALNQQMSQLDDQARQAVGQGNDDEARRILARKVSLEKGAAELSERHADLKAEEDKLHDSARKMEQDVEDFRARKDTLAARHTAASAQAGMNDASKGITSAAGDVGQAMEAAERRTRELEASADAVDELVREGLISKPGESANAAASRRFDAALDSPEVSRQMDELTDGNKTDGAK